jgi:NTP pyrophosphatase (non-canonical NTP hydrolase)
MKDTDKLQHAVGSWAVETFDLKRKSLNPVGLASAYHLREEVDELIDAIQNGASDQEIQEEAADCFSLLCGIAHRREFSLHDALVRKYEINRNRTWGQVAENGVIHHVGE